MTFLPNFLPGLGNGRLVKNAADATSWQISGLNGNRDGEYYMRGVIHVPAASGGTVYTFQPNALTTNMVSFTNSGVGAYATNTDLRFTTSINLATGPIALWFEAYWQCQTTVGGVAVWRTFQARSHLPFNVATAYQTTYNGNGVWQETSTNITDMFINASTAGGILAGSQLRIWPTSIKLDAAL